MESQNEHQACHPSHFVDKSGKCKVKVPGEIGLVYEFAPRISPFHLNYSSFQIVPAQAVISSPPSH